MRQEDVVYYIHSDHLGSTSLTTDQSQQVVARQVYYPYGTPRWSQGTLPTDFAFTGQRDEAGLGLMHYGALFYSPRLGRFVSADSIVPQPGEPQALNRYSYVYNNPLRHTDPSGYGPPDWWDRIVRAIREWWESDEVQLRWAEITSALKRENEVRSPSLWDPSTYREKYRARTLMSDPEGMRKAEQAAIIIELAFGFAPNLARLKRQNPEARVIGIERPEMAPFEADTSYQEAIEAGAELMFLDYRKDLPKDLFGSVDEVIVIAPQPWGNEWSASSYETAEAMADLVKPGGHIYVAAGGAATADRMAEVFNKQFGMTVEPREIPRFEVPFESDYLRDRVWVIDFFTPK